MPHVAPSPVNIIQPAKATAATAASTGKTAAQSSATAAGEKPFDQTLKGAQATAARKTTKSHSRPAAKDAAKKPQRSGQQKKPNSGSDADASEPVKNEVAEAEPVKAEHDRSSPPGQDDAVAHDAEQAKNQAVGKAVDQQPDVAAAVMPVIPPMVAQADQSATQPEAEASSPAGNQAAAPVQPRMPHVSEVDASEEQMQATESASPQNVAAGTAAAVPDDREGAFAQAIQKVIAADDTDDGGKPQTIATNAVADGSAAPSQAPSPPPATPTHTTPAAPLPPAGVLSEADFAQVNHPQIVTAVRSQLMPHGGSMQIRLDPPELGTLQVRIDMRDGVMNASFQTSNDQATQLLSHSLTQLKHSLEAQGVTVQRLQVHQAPAQNAGGGGDDAQQQPQQQGQNQSFNQEQQRRQMLRRMWRDISHGRDPLDTIA